jgi:hypothetical protein
MTGEVIDNHYDRVTKTEQMEPREDYLREMIR